MHRHPSDERGAVLIHVLVALIVLLAFGAYAVDNGVLWVARSQAQAAADAGAHAGAVALALDGADDRSDAGPAKQIAHRVARSGDVWGEAPGVDIANDVTFPACPDDGSADCIQVEVHRDASAGNPLPSWFGTFINVDEQGIRARAIAKAATANASDCLKPFAVPDLYNELSSPANQYFDQGVDSYTPPGYTLDAIGTELVVRAQPPADNKLGPGWFRLVDLMGGVAGGTSDLRSALRSCSADVHAIGEDLIQDHGAKSGINSAIQDLIDLDPDAYWDSSTETVQGSCAAEGTCQQYLAGMQNNDSPIADPGRAYSPRIVPLPVFDPELYATTGRVHVVNIYGFFLTAVSGNGNNLELRGIIVNQPGLLAGNGGEVDDDAAFLKVIQLIR